MLSCVSLTTPSEQVGEGVRGRDPASSGAQSHRSPNEATSHQRQRARTFTCVRVRALAHAISACPLNL